MDLKKKPESKLIYVLGDDGLKKLDFQYLDDDFALVFHEKKVIVPRDLDESFYDNFSKLFDNRYVFREGIDKNYKDENVISYVSDDFLEVKSGDDYDRVVITRDEDGIEFDFVNDSKKDEPINGIGIISFSPLGMGRYARNVRTGGSLQEDMIEAFETVLKSEKTLGRKK